MTERFQYIIQDFEQFAATNGQDPYTRDTLEVFLTEANSEDVASFLNALADMVEQVPEYDSAPLHWFVQRIATRCRSPEMPHLELDEPLIDAVLELDRVLPDDSAARSYALCMLAQSPRPKDIERLVDVLVERPLVHIQDVGVVMSPLFQRTELDVNCIFPALFEGLTHRVLAGFILDLANHMVRSERTETHPAADRLRDLMTLLDAMTANLESMEARTVDDMEQLNQLKSVVEESISIAVSLCDALGLIGDRAAIPKIERALQLRHRRLRTEAAAALVRLGEEQAVQVLCEMASEPIARLRVIQFATELEIDEYVEDQYKTLVAQAESEVALWLTQPEQIGFPPHELELYDEREQFWPGYDDPVVCYLFRFAYRWSDGKFSNIAIAGPTVHAMSCDLCDLPPDDIYAIFAGWYAEHEDIYEIPIQLDNPEHQLELTRYRRRLEDRGFSSITPKYMAAFFGERALVVQVTYEGKPGVAVVDSNDVIWLPAKHSQRPFQPEDVLFLYRGKKLLRSFNPEDDAQ